ncbi:peptidase M15D vanX D-ala-D-ala dipeptidase [Patescibacteria group bacterium]|nr:peptidase M15D vanX D-ala-D-ala dipeptidase [Patescibacteria group bacterium]
MLENVLELKNLPIPQPGFDVELVRNYQGVKINKEGSFFREELVDIRTLGVKGLNYYNSTFNPPYYQSIPGSISSLKVRKTVAEKLAAVNEKLKTIGLEIFVFDAFRPLAVQNYFYYEWVPRYLRSIYPDKDELWILQESNAYWAKGARNKDELLASAPPHSTGGAVDMTFCFKETGHLLEMGSIFDDITEKSHTIFFEKDLDLKSFTATEAMKNRRLLYHLMTTEGFASHPKEWWHFSYGDQMWALITNQAEALYGYAGNDFQT